MTHVATDIGQVDSNGNDYFYITDGETEPVVTTDEVLALDQSQLESIRDNFNERIATIQSCRDSITTAIGG